MTDAYDALQGWIARHRRDLHRLDETPDFERGFKTALDKTDRGLNSCATKGCPGYLGPPAQRDEYGHVALLGSPVGVEPLSNVEADRLLSSWGHYLGPCTRPFGKQSFVLHVDGRPVSMATSASTVSSTVRLSDHETMGRRDVVELARLCSAPGESWATRVMLRLWREVHAQQWPHWPVRAAVAYSQNDRHEGRIYRFDGWAKARETPASGGGGQWTDKRAEGHVARGTKSLWLWRYEVCLPPASPSPEEGR